MSGERENISYHEIDKLLVTDDRRRHQRDTAAAMFRALRAAARPALAIAGAALVNNSTTTCATQREISPATHAELEKLRPGEEAMRQKWEEDESGWHKLPPRAWPPVQPKFDEVDALRKAAASPTATKQTLFDLATCLTFNMIDPVEGLRRYRELEKGGSLDASVAIATILLEGIGRDLDDASDKEAVGILSAASAKGHSQAQYELGCLHYLGSHPSLAAEDDNMAYALFEAAADQKHTSALFMQAEFLLEGRGHERDDAKAVPLLHAAALRGHRMARQYIRELLDADTAHYASLLKPIERAKRHAARLPPLPPEGSEHFAVYRGDGSKATIDELLNAASDCDVVLLGETHDDPIAHSLEAFLLISLAARREKVTLSLEMFERDVQTVLDEYLKGLVRERDLLQDCRPWANYHEDYRPLVEFAKECGMPVIAANAPRRYVGAVGREAGVLTDPNTKWPSRHEAWLPPLPLPPPSTAYLQHLQDDPAVVRSDQIGLDDEFGPANHGGGEEDGEAPTGKAGERRCPYIGLKGRDGLLEPMLLWDAGMAHSIAGALEADAERLVVHVCGAFHCEKRLGIAEMVSKYKPEAKQLVVVLYPDRDCHDFVPGRHGGLGDYVVLTDASVARSHDYLA